MKPNDDTNPPRDYKSTLNLPRTEFPMKANLREREPALLQKWEREKTFETMLERTREGERFVLHDGPPYANGHIHMGHALNKVLKDMVVKSKSLSGFHAPFVPGWDCHGLPIELEVQKKEGTARKGHKETLDRIAECRGKADEFVAVQKKEFIRLGVFGDWGRHYETMDPSYEATIVREFGRLVGKNLIVRKKRPVYWCMSCRTALADAEVEYDEKESPSIHVKFPVTPKGPWPEQTSAVIWTTTPWTLPANLALCFHPERPYVLVRHGSDGEHWIVAKARLEALKDLPGGSPLAIVRELTSAELESIRFDPPFPKSPQAFSRSVFDGGVSMEDGTGIVHIAPGHGDEDYRIGLTYGLEVYSPVGPGGEFTDEVPKFAGQGVYRANPAIVEDLKRRNLLVHEGKITHSYPHCWRCHKPVIFRATPQWFMSLETGGLRAAALEEIDRVKWIPSWGRERIYNMLKSRTDWCLSRQRVWGVPIPCLICTGCDEAERLDPDFIEQVARGIETGGIKYWRDGSATSLIGDRQCSKCGAELELGQDILDVWFDSGVSFAKVLEQGVEAGLTCPADLYLEGSDQHRGWFHSSLLLSVATRGAAPYRSVLTHGFVVDGQGKKMSKSAGNVMAPDEVITKYGAEIVRLWVASEDYSEDVRLSDEILSRLADAYRRIRNTCRFILGNLYDFRPDAAMGQGERLQEIDRWALHRAAVVGERIQRAYDSYSFHTVYHALHQYCVVDLSSLYLDISKDRLYCDTAAGEGRRSAQFALFHILKSLARNMAPVLSFLAEEVWGHLPDWDGKPASVFLSGAAERPRSFRDDELGKLWDNLLELRSEVMKALESERASKVIGSSTEASVELGVMAGGIVEKSLRDVSPEALATLFVVSEVSMTVGNKATVPDFGESGHMDIGGRVFIAHRLPGMTYPELGIRVTRAGGANCHRCRRSDRTVESPGGLCARCCSVVDGGG